MRNLNVELLTLLTQNRKGFILTMRNLNNSTDDEKKEFGLRFILTMRNLNFGEITRLILMEKGFILTMRNLNKN